MAPLKSEQATKFLFELVHCGLRLLVDGIDFIKIKSPATLESYQASLHGHTYYES